MFCSLFVKEKKCSHSRVTPDKESAYCPDCGEYVKNKWYLTRCTCCSIKRKTIVKFATMRPASNFCPNCGCKDYFIQEIKKINFIDINFAVLQKEPEIPPELSFASSQSWFDKNEEVNTTKYLPKS